MGIFSDANDVLSHYSHLKRGTRLNERICSEQPSRIQTKHSITSKRNKIGKHPPLCLAFSYLVNLIALPVSGGPHPFG